MNTNTSNKQTTTALVVGVVLLLGSLLALNGGTPLAASAFDQVSTTVRNMLSSTMVVAFALLALFAAVWQITHGHGYGTLSLVLGVLCAAIIGPAMVTSISTTTRTAGAAVLTQEAARPHAPTLLSQPGLLAITSQP